MFEIILILDKILLILAGLCQRHMTIWLSVVK